MALWHAEYEGMDRHVALKFLTTCGGYYFRLRGKWLSFEPVTKREADVLLDEWLHLARVRRKPPVITSADAAMARVGENFSYQVVASNDPTSFLAVGLPSGLEMNPSNGKITGNPTTEGTFKVMVEATNAYGTGRLSVALAVKSGASGPKG